MLTHILAQVSSVDPLSLGGGGVGGLLVAILGLWIRERFMKQQDKDRQPLCKHEADGYYISKIDCGKKHGAVDTQSALIETALSSLQAEVRTISDNQKKSSRCLSELNITLQTFMARIEERMSAQDKKAS